jgi:hypothetical protein
MLIALGFLIGFAAVPVLGGRVGALAETRLRGRGILVAGLALQIVIISVAPGGSEDLHAGAHVLSYVAVACFVAANRAVPYVWLIALGGALNFAAIAANGGVMPADPQALAAAGLDSSADAFANSAAVAHARLQFLGDIAWVPAGWPASNVFSVGDVAIVVGAWLSLHTLCGSRLALPRFAVLSRPVRRA